MNAYPVFRSQISGLRRSAFLKLVERLLTMVLLFVLFFYSLDLILLRTLFVGSSGFFLYCFPASAALWIVYTWIRRKSLMHELIEIDHRLQLKEKLSSAYECHQLGSRSPLAALLIEDVSKLLTGIDRRTLFPRKFSMVHVSILLLAAMAIVLRLFDFTPDVSPQTLLNREKISQIGSMIEQYSKKERKKAVKDRKKAGKELFREMDKLARNLQKPSISRERAIKSLGRLLERVEAEGNRLANSLGNQLNQGDIARTPMLKPIQRERITPNELKQLKDQLGKLFKGGIPPSISRDISQLAQQRRNEEFLNKAMTEFRSLSQERRNSSGSETENESVVERIERRGNTEEGKTAKDSKATRSDPDSKGKKASSRGTIASEMKKDPAGDLRNPLEQFGPNSMTSAGREKAEGNKKSPYELESSKSSAVKHLGIFGDGAWYNMHIRTLTTIGRMNAKEEEMIRSYQRDLDNALLKEEIPLNFREYIKNYFLSIGLRKEEK